MLEQQLDVDLHVGEHAGDLQRDETLQVRPELRAQESFAFNWKDEPGVGDGHGSFWISPGVPIVFKYAGSRDPAVNREWLRVLRESANHPSGLRLLPEPEGPGS